MVLCVELPIRLIYAVVKVLARPKPSSLQHRLSSIHRVLNLYPLVIGGGKRTRTADILLAKQALYQLSYTPIPVGHPGLEPGTSPLSGVRSNHLS